MVQKTTKRETNYEKSDEEGYSLRYGRKIKTVNIFKETMESVKKSKYGDMAIQQFSNDAMYAAVALSRLLHPELQVTLGTLNGVYTAYVEDTKRNTVSKVGAKDGKPYCYDDKSDKCEHVHAVIADPVTAMKLLTPKEQ